MRRIVYILAFVILLGGGFTLRAQERMSSPDVMRQLLRAPAPPPRNAEAPKPTRQREPSFYNKNNPPPDDAPLEDLFDYWQGTANPAYKGHLSDTVRRRLLNGYADDLGKLSSLLSLFKSSDEFAKRIKEAFDKAEDAPELAYPRQEIKKWLTYNSGYYVAELRELANEVDESDKYSFIENANALEALAKFDWPSAKPRLETLVNTGRQRISTLALTLFYQQSIDEKDATAELKLRGQLQSIASDRSFPGRARYYAIEALSTTEWSGRDEWYLTLFSDETLISLADESASFSPLGTLFTRDPDKWIPVMTRLVAGKDQVRQQAAASCLVRYAIASPRRDAILPVLRWLTDPDWIPISDTERAWFMQTMNNLDVPESIPGLIWIVENDQDNRQWAARTLAHYKDPRAIGPLKKALAESKNNIRTYLLDGLLGSGGLTEAEQVDAIEAYATTLTELGRNKFEQYRSDDDELLPVPVSTGHYLASRPIPPDNLVRSVLARAASLERRNKAVSKTLVEIAHGWQSRFIDLDLIKRIAANTAEAIAILNALSRRDELRKSVSSEVHSLVAASGAPQGIGAILVEDTETAGELLISADQAAQIALLACARLTQTALPVHLVGPLLKSQNSLLQLAAERYLLNEDSNEARTLLWQHHPNKAFITGWRPYSYPEAGYSLAPLEKLEEKFRVELSEPDGPTEIFALTANRDDGARVLRVYKDKAVYTLYEDSTRYHEREISKAELSDFKDFVSKNQLGEVGPQLAECYHHCWSSEFLLLTKERGRRVFLIQPMSGLASGRMAIFDRLGRGEGAKTRYNFEKNIKGLEHLFADADLTVMDVWQRGDEVRIFVEREETEEEQARVAEADEDKLPDVERWQRERARTRERFSWRRLKNRDANSVTTTPEGYSNLDETKFPFDEADESADREDVQVISADTILIARNFAGLWKQVAGTKAVRISRDEGAYANLVVTPDGKWAVVSWTDTDWSKPNHLVRLNLETGREFRVKLEPADVLEAISFVPVHGKILVRRSKDANEPPEKSVGPPAAEHYLLDPATGALQSVTGKFEPLYHRGQRFLQPTGTPGEYWAAVSDENKKHTEVGRYNLKDFSFIPVLVLPQISFDSTSIWVDEKQAKVYLVYRGELLRLPLKKVDGVK